MRSLKKRGPHVLDDLMTSYFPYNFYMYFLASKKAAPLKSAALFGRTVRTCLRPALVVTPLSHHTRFVSQAILVCPCTK